MHVEHLRQTSGSEDVFYEVLLKAGFALTTEVKAVNFRGQPIVLAGALAFQAIQIGGLFQSELGMGNRLTLPDEVLLENVRALQEANGIEKVQALQGRKFSIEMETGGAADDVMKAQVRETVEQHLKKERLLQGWGIKILSLFFVNRVASCRAYRSDGTTSLGKIGRWFEEAYKEVTAGPLHQTLPKFEVTDVHNGHFAQDRQGHAKDTRGNTADDDAAYNLIMREKERLLDPAVPLRFIFSRSTLREGWDNPNVFQICTLNETQSPEKKRQETGRGLRLPVNAAGERVHDETVNRLTAIANKS